MAFPNRVWDGAPNCIVLYVTGNDEDTDRYTFATMTEAASWWDYLGDIKNSMIGIKDAVNRENLTDNIVLLSCFVPWMQRVGQFARHWGNDCVPLDVKRALRTTEETLGVVVTIWGDPRVDTANGPNGGDGDDVPNNDPAPAQG